MARRLRARAWDWYVRVSPHLIIPIGLVAAIAMVVAASAAVTNGQQDRRDARDSAARDAQVMAVQAAQQKLLECFDRYAAVSSTSSKEVRDASVQKDDAMSGFFTTLGVEGRAFKRVTHRILTSDVTAADVRHLDHALALRAHAQLLLEQAQDALDQARADNPIPDPPSEFCGSDADQEGLTQ